MEVIHDNFAIHHSSEWEFDETHRLFGVEMDVAELQDRYHYSHCISAESMRKLPTSFSQFRPGNKFQKKKNAFHWWLDFMKAMIGSKEKGTNQNSGSGAVGFVEWCPSSRSTKEKIDTAGWRFHVFVDRGVNEMKVLRDFFNKLKKEVAGLKKTGKHVDPYCHINTYDSYASKIYRTYSGEIADFEQLYDAEQTNPDASPSNLFRMRQIDGSIYPLDSYLDATGRFVFPSHNFIKLDIENISVEMMAHRKLPDYVLFNLVKPEVRVSSEPFLVEFLAHRNFKDYEIADEAMLSDFLQEHGEDFMVYQKGLDCTSKVGELTYSEVLDSCDGEQYMNEYSADQLTGEAEQERAKQMTRQAAQSEIDRIKIEALQLKDTGKLRTRTEIQNYIHQEFLARVWNDPDAFVSDPISIIIKWFHKQYDPSLIKAYPMKFRGVSAFGHCAINKMLVYDALYQIANAHREAYWCLLSRLDAFRHEYNLHLNAIFIGDAATSKSFLQWIVEINSVGETTRPLTYKTKRSDAVDHDDNHFVRVFDELPANFLYDPKNTDEDATLKTKMTKQQITHERPFTDEKTGERKKIVGKSSCIDCMIGASNEPRHKFSEALQSRVHFFESEKCVTGKTIQQCKTAWDTMKPEQKAKINEHHHNHRFEQGFSAMVWTYIRMGAICRPDTSIVGMIIQRVMQELETFGIPGDERRWERVKIICLHLAVARAEFILYKTINGKYANQQFHPDHLLDVEPLLICTEEIVLHAVGLEFDTVVSKSQAKILRAIWTIHSQNPQYKTAAEPDFNYIEINGSKKKITSMILNAIQASGQHVSRPNIQTCLQNMSDGEIQIKSRHYVKEGVGFSDGFPGYIPGDQTERSHAQCIIEGTKVQIHLNMFSDIRCGVHDNIYKTIVLRLMHRFTANKKIVLGMNLTSEPKFWETVDFQAAEELIKQTRGCGVQHTAHDDLFGKTEDSDYICENDLDVEAAEHRSETVGYDIEPYQPHDTDYDSTSYGYPLRHNKRNHGEI